MAIEKAFNDVKSIEFQVFFDGNGCVNYDTPDQIYQLNKMGFTKGDERFWYGNDNSKKLLNNIKFSKKTYRPKTQNSNEYEQCTYISADALRKALFKDAIPFISPTIQTNPYVLHSCIAHPSMLLRGYLFPGSQTPYKRTGPFSITDAREVYEGTCDNVWKDYVDITIHSRSGFKESKDGKGKEDAKDTSLYWAENIGKSQYMANGYIDLGELSFISCDKLYDRQNVQLDGGVFANVYMDNLKRHMVNFTPEPKYYYMSNTYTEDEWAEFGILLNQESVDMMVKQMLMRLCTMSIYRSTAMLKTSKVIITVNFENGSETFEITNDDINKFWFGYKQTYFEADESKIIAHQKLMEEINPKSKQKNTSNKKSSKKENDDESNGTED